MSEAGDSVFEFIREMLGSIVPFATHVGVGVDRVGDGTAVATLPDAEQLKNHVGTQHAGALYTVAEAASGAAMAGAMAPFVADAVSVVKQSSSRFTAPARGPITATAVATRDAAEVRGEYEKAGRTAFTMQVTLTDEAGTSVAAMDFEWVVRSPSM